MLDFFIENFRTIIALASLIFGIWQYFQRRKIEQIYAAEAIELHNNIATALATGDNAKLTIDQGNDPSFLIGRMHGLCKAVLHESAKLYCNIKNTTRGDIDDLIKNEQLAKEYKDIYYSYARDERGFFTDFVHKIKKRI